MTLAGRQWCQIVQCFIFISVQKLLSCFSRLIKLSDMPAENMLGKEHHAGVLWSRTAEIEFSLACHRIGCAVETPAQVFHPGSRCLILYRNTEALHMIVVSLESPQAEACAGLHSVSAYTFTFPFMQSIRSCPGLYHAVHSVTALAWEQTAYDTQYRFFLLLQPAAPPRCCDKA